MNNLCFVINEKGERVTSLVDNFLANDELVERTRALYPGYEYAIGDDDMLIEFLSGKIYKEGKFVDAPVVEPTATEIKKTKIAEINKKYEEKFKTYESALMRARLAGNDEAVDKLQEVYKSDMAAMMSEIKGV